MGQSTSNCFEGDSDVNGLNNRNAFHPLSSQDAERTRFQQKAFSSEASSSNTSAHINMDQNTTWGSIPSLKEDENDNGFLDKLTKGKSEDDVALPKSNLKLDQKHKPKRIRLRRKNKDFVDSTRLISNGIMSLKNDALQRTLYFFANDDDSTDLNESPGDIDQSTNGSEHNSYHEVVEYTGIETTKTKLVIRDELDVKTALMKKLPRGKKETFIESILVCGTQIYTKRIRLNGLDSDDSIKSFTLTKRSRASNVPLITLQDVDPNKTHTITNDSLKEILREKKNAEKNNIVLQRPGCNGRFKGKKVLESHATSWSNGPIITATVEDGIARKLFTPDATLETTVEPVSEMVCVCSENDIYVCDIGLTSSRCDFIVNTSERCANGSYNAYTYAKQTLGCREFDELAVVCEWPVMRAIVSIREHLEQASKVKESAPTENERTLVLDVREPHIVKYDVSRKERQKLDMHTDKSEWTFLIALTDGIGDDYDGGGTYFECIDSTVHLEKGHALIFPGRLRHRGQKIICGKRFLLVGFLVERN